MVVLFKYGACAAKMPDLKVTFCDETILIQPTCLTDYNCKARSQIKQWTADSLQIHQWEGSD